MLALFFVLVAAAGTHADCPPDFMNQFHNCLTSIAPMNNNMKEACSTVNNGLACIDDIVRQCKNNPDLQAILETLELDIMRSMCAVSEESDECPNNPLQRMQSCMNDIQMGSGASGAESCRLMTKGVDCLESLADVCQGNPQLQVMLQEEHISQMRHMANMICSNQGQPPLQPPDQPPSQPPVQPSVQPPVLPPVQPSVQPPVQPSVQPSVQPPASTCDEPRPAKAIKRCNRRIISLKTANKNKKARCRAILRGFQCLRDLLIKCPDDPVISSHTTLEKLSKHEASVIEACRQPK